MILEKPIQITFGIGKVLIIRFSDEDGHGIILKNSEEIHQVGESVPQDKDVVHFPQPGEIYLKFTSLESLNVFKDMLTSVEEQFK
ncbi:MAG TPA: hypothetical protein PLP33_27780 [Leptospiraceae bacterium]|nr:hypothetical protein [Leptospiraceae bacterium]